ncbi:MAG TPA: YraN family protein [Candidatus Paceibacterota bacterium]|nr:YraN family protein [Candidatus Paceibacterota bacterium]
MGGKTTNSIVGALGEDIACRYIKSKRYTVLYRNHRQGWDEIDIISRSLSSKLVFFEVKTILGDVSENEPIILPEDNMTSAKLKKLRRGCTMFVGKHPELIRDEVGWQIDLLAIVLLKGGLDSKGPTIRHYENI